MVRAVVLAVERVRGLSGSASGVGMNGRHESCIRSGVRGAKVRIGTVRD